MRDHQATQLPDGWKRLRLTRRTRQPIPVFIGGAQGGVWETTDGGVTWQPLTDSQPSLAMGALAIAIDSTNSLDPKHRVIYAATGRQAGSGVDVYYGAGVLKSLDGGQTWAQTCQGSALTNPACPFVGPFSSGFIPGGGARISSLGVNPGNPRMLIAGVQIFTSSNITGQTGQPGVYCTGDGGTTWSRIQPTGVTVSAMATAAFYVSSTTAYAAIGDYGGDATNGIYVSHNADQACSAQTWARVTGTGLASQVRLGRIELAAAPALVNGQVVLYAGIADANTNSNSLLGVYRSADGGTTWTQLSGIPDFCEAQCSYDLVIGVDPADATGNTVFFGGAGVAAPAGTTLLRSIDGGQTFGDVSVVGDGTILHANHHAIAFTSSGNKMYVGNDGGVWSSTNVLSPATAAGSQVWTDLNNELALTQFNPGLSIHSANVGLAFGGTQGDGTQEFQNFTGSGAWSGTNTCTNGGFTIVDANDQSSVYLSCAGISGVAQILQVRNQRSFGRIQFTCQLGHDWCSSEWHERSARAVSSIGRRSAACGTSLFRNVPAVRDNGRRGYMERSFWRSDQRRNCERNRSYVRCVRTAFDQRLQSVHRRG